jgi:hypothetical protein
MPAQELRVLIIDDEPDIAAMLVDSIEGLCARAPGRPLNRGGRR